MKTAALSLAQNTASAPDWIEFIPAGAEVVGVDGRRWRNPDPQGIVTATNAAARPLPVDWEHATEERAPKGLPAPAAGWIDRLEVRGGATWGQVEWTKPGREHVASRQYRFVSPVFTFAKTTGRIGALKSVGLTNTPNLTLTALNRREKETTMDQLEELWSILGLDENATPADVIGKVRALAVATAANRIDPTEWVPMATFEAVTKELNARNQGMTDELAELHVAEAIGSGRMVPALRDWGLALCRTNRPAFDSFIERTKGPLGEMFGTAVLQGRKPPGSDGTALSDTETLIARQLGHTPADMARS